MDNFRGDANVIRIASIYLPAWPYPTLRSVSFPLSGGLRINSIMRSFQPEIVHVHGHHYPLSWVTLREANRNNIPSVLTMHGMYVLNPKAPEGKSYVEKTFNKLIFPRVISKSSAVVGLSNSITAYALKFKANNVKFVTIGNGIDTNIYAMNRQKKLEYRRQYNIQENTVVVLFRGRLEDVKGIIEFCLAAKEVTARLKDKVEIVIVGKGSLERKVKSILGETNHVHIYGWQPMDKVHELYILSDIFVLPSKAEALPITIIEAMNALLHIVFAPVGGVADVLNNYSAKTCLSRVTPDEIAAVLICLVMNPNYPDRSSATYARQYDWRNVTKALRELYQELLTQ